jgi:hypothetical protein
MLLSTVSLWDEKTMEKLTRLHGITVHKSCIRHGFDWRRRELIPEIAQMYGKVHVKDRDAVLARDSMLTYFRAGRIRHDEEIPTKQSDRDNIQKILIICDSLQTDPNHPSLFLMSPEHIRTISCDSLQTDPNHPSLFLMSPEHIRTINSILQRSRQVADAPIQESEVPIPPHESATLLLVNSDSAAPRPQRRAAAEGAKRNAEILQQMQESTIYSSEEEGYCDWGEDGDKPSDDDD